MGKIVLLIVFLIFTSLDVWAAARYGPFDYSNPEHRAMYLEIVEKHHFNDDVRHLRHGQTGSIWGDLGYVLRVFPNHHPALNTIMRLHFRANKPMHNAPSAERVERYFTDAKKYAPHDPMIDALYGIYLHRSGRMAEAEQQYKRAIVRDPDMSEVHYNIGLLYLEQKKYQEAKEHAGKAYELGYPLPGLRDRLKNAGLDIK